MVSVLLWSSVGVFWSASGVLGLLVGRGVFCGLLVGSASASASGVLVWVYL